MTGELVIRTAATASGVRNLRLIDLSLRRDAACGGADRCGAA
jgi:hypothetical protein